MTEGHITSVLFLFGNAACLFVITPAGLLFFLTVLIVYFVIKFYSYVLSRLAFT